MPESTTPQAPKAPPKKKVPHKYSVRQHREGVRLYAEIGPREASKRLGIPEATIRKWGKAAGKKPPTANINAGVQAQEAKMAARRAALASDLLSDAERLRQQLWQECKVFNFGGKDNTFAEQEFEEPPAKDKKDLLLACAIAIDKSLVLEKHDSDGGMGLPAVDEWLAHTKGKS